MSGPFSRNRKLRLTHPATRFAADEVAVATMVEWIMGRAYEFGGEMPSTILWAQDADWWAAFAGRCGLASVSRRQQRMVCEALDRRVEVARLEALWAPSGGGAL